MQEYIDGIPTATRSMFDRLHRLIMQAHPGADVLLSYRMPTYAVGTRRLYVAAWKHGLSVYGWSAGRDGGFAARHPELESGKGTLRLTHAVWSELPDSELLELVDAALRE